MSVTINVNNLSLCHKGSNGISTATLPDVCKTPSPGGPVPMPYPNVSMSSDLASGTTTVTADGGNMIAIKGSEFSRSTGDEPGTVGGLKSNVNMKASKWLLYSFDVKFDGANACRLTDKKTQNNENTVDATGEVQPNLVVTTLQDIACKCNKIEPDLKKDTCRSLGEDKHKCCDDAIKNHKPPPEIDGEKGYNRDGSPFTNGPRQRLPGEGFFAHLNRIRGTVWPDACSSSGGQPTQLFDFKFACPAGVSTRKAGNPPYSLGGAPQGFTPGKNGKPGQLEKYEDLSRSLGIDPESNPPTVISNEECS